MEFEQSFYLMEEFQLLDFFELDMKEGRVQLAKLTTVQIRLPDEPAFDTYSLKEASADDIKAVEQGKG